MTPCRVVKTSPSRGAASLAQPHASRPGRQQGLGCDGWRRPRGSPGPRWQGTTGRSNLARQRPPARRLALRRSFWPRSGGAGVCPMGHPRRDAPVSARRNHHRRPLVSSSPPAATSPRPGTVAHAARSVGSSGVAASLCCARCALPREHDASSKSTKPSAHAAPGLGSISSSSARPAARHSGPASATSREPKRPRVSCGCWPGPWSVCVSVGWSSAHRRRGLDVGWPRAIPHKHVAATSRADRRR